MNSLLSFFSFFSWIYSSYSWNLSVTEICFFFSFDFFWILIISFVLSWYLCIFSWYLSMDLFIQKKSYYSKEIYLYKYYFLSVIPYPWALLSIYLFVFLTVRLAPFLFFYLRIFFTYSNLFYRFYRFPYPLSVICFSHWMRAASGWMVMFGFTFFFSSWGPSVTTFIIPSELFPTSWRVTGYSICAAAGER